MIGVGFRAVITTGGGSSGRPVVIDHAVLKSPQEALRWLDEGLARYEVKSLLPRARRAMIRALRGDLRCRAQWLDGNAARPYHVVADAPTSPLHGQVSHVLVLPLLGECLRLESPPWE